MGVAVIAWSVAVLAITTSTATGQSAEPLDQAAIGRIDPASMIDVESFSARADRWAAAQAEHRQAAVARAETLAAETKAAEEAEQARLEEEAARREAEEEARRQAEEAARREAAAATTTTTTTTTVAPGDGSDGDGGGPEEPPPSGPTEEQWHALRDCESSNNYRAVSPTGRYRGAYQFSITTWDWLAASRYPELVGVDPIDASPGDQDRMAYALYGIYGSSPWPVCGEHLP